MRWFSVVTVLCEILVVALAAPHAGVILIIDKDRKYAFERNNEKYELCVLLLDFRVVCSYIYFNRS